MLWPTSISCVHPVYRTTTCQFALRQRVAIHISPLQPHTESPSLFWVISVATYSQSSHHSSRSCAKLNPDHLIFQPIATLHFREFHALTNCTPLRLFSAPSFQLLTHPLILGGPPRQLFPSTCHHRPTCVWNIMGLLNSDVSLTTSKVVIGAMPPIFLLQRTLFHKPKSLRDRAFRV